MINTIDLSSYYPGYDKYCEPKEDSENNDESIDELIDDMRLEILEKESD